MSDIFISYASEDKSKVEPLAEALEAQGWSVWCDRHIPAGKDLNQLIQEAIDEGDASSWFGWPNLFPQGGPR